MRNRVTDNANYLSRAAHQQFGHQENTSGLSVVLSPEELVIRISEEMLGRIIRGEHVVPPSSCGRVNRCLE